jgi:uncharacterized protein YqgQ
MRNLSKQIAEIKAAQDELERMLNVALLQTAAFAHLDNDFGPANLLLKTVSEIDREAVITWFEKASLVICRDQADVVVCGVRVVDDVQKLLRDMKKISVFPDPSRRKSPSIFVRTVSGGLPSLGRRAK